MNMSFEEFKPLIEFPTQSSLETEIRFCMQYLKANKLSQSAKWLGELLVTLSGSQNPNGAKSEANSAPLTF
jgi:hypothetical protein